MEFSHSVSESGINVIRVRRMDGRSLGSLTYYPEAEPDKIRLNTVYVGEEYTRRGIGTALVEEFTQTVGPNKRVSSLITNSETFEQLYELGIFEEALLHSKFVIIGTLPLFSRFPVIKTFSRGGIETDSLTIHNWIGVTKVSGNMGKLAQVRKKGVAHMYGLFHVEFSGKT